MYQVQYRVIYATTMDRGNVIVCAANRDAATDMVLALLKLPGSRTQFEVVRIKPSLFEVEKRKQIPLNKPKPSLRNHGLRK